MSKPEFWWCVKDLKGNLLVNTAQKKKTDGFMMQDGESIVRIRVEEVGRKK